MADEPVHDAGGEIALTGPAGVGVRAKGYRLMDVAWAMIAAGLAWGAWELKAHAGDAERQSQAVVKSITEANTAIVKALERVADEQKEARIEQKKSTAAMNVVACLQDPAMKSVNNAREVCRRIILRDDR